MRAAFRTISCRKVQIGSIRRRKVANLRRATEQISSNSPLFYRLNAIMLFLHATLWKDKLSLAPFYGYCHSKVRNFATDGGSPSILVIPRGNKLAKHWPSTLALILMR